MVTKTRDYASKDYVATAVFAAGRADALTPYADISRSIISQVIPDWSVETAFVDDMDEIAAGQTVLDAIEAGVALTNYFGHSGFAEWGLLGVSDLLLTSSDVTALANAGRPTLVNQWGCWNAYYVDPHSGTLSHAFLAAGPGGAAAVLGPVSLARTSSEHLLGNLSLPLMLQPGNTIGEAILEAKRQLAAAHPGREDVIWGYTLLGDPALIIEP